MPKGARTRCRRGGTPGTRRLVSAVTKGIVVAALALLAAACAGAPPGLTQVGGSGAMQAAPPPPQPPAAAPRSGPRLGPAFVEVGVASWYGPGYHGRRTASGEVFDMNAMTAAHRRLPFGTMVRVTNLRNGRAVLVVVNDRGPFVRGRIIDLSRRAAELLGFARDGTVRVQVEAAAIAQR